MRFSGLAIEEGVSLAPLTTWHVGGKAEYFFKPNSLEELQRLIRVMPADMPKYFLGLGSNVLIRDGGIQGLVIYTRGLLHHHQEAETLFVEAGVASAKVAKLFAKLAWLGGSFLSGIPGSFGGALAMNAGAFGAETWPLVQRVLVLEKNGELVEHPASAFTVGYREVRGPMGLGFVGAWLRGEVGDAQAAEAEMLRCLQRRKQTQPIGTWNAGSIFRNPPGDHAARLIEASGLKGHAIGGARVSSKHANFIVNEGEATAEDIEALIDWVQKTVQEQFGVQLEKEVRIIGEKPCN